MRLPIRSRSPRLALPPSLTVVTPYGEKGPSSRVRVFEWLEYLGLAATRLDYAGLSSNSPAHLMRHPVAALRAEARLRNSEHFAANQIVLVSKQASPFSLGRLEERLLSRSARGVYDFDDSLVDEPSSLHGMVFNKARIWLRAVRAADVVIAGNDYLASQAREVCRDGSVVVIPSCVDPNRYRQKLNYELGSRPRAIWLGSPSTEPHLRTLTTPLLQLHRTHGLELTVVSTGERSLGPLEEMTSRVDWTPDSIQLLAEADFGLMPLSDDSQARGKCAYKLLQYAAAALPAIASPVGANAVAVNRGIGTSADTPEAWIHAMTETIEYSGRERAQIGARARATVGAHYSFDAWRDQWRSAVLG